ncbi:MAG: hypothetical protein OXE92_02790 [Bacteroidetes bacterium]|nr:hypothetical protein [Bacteroidota bacterium]MCY4204635.1 hypothetical protein [Bacteroidota bacterium]
MSEPDLEQLRADLLEQLCYMLDEIASLRQVTSRMHEAQITNTERGLSVKQCYGAIIMRDRNEILPALQKLSGCKRFRKVRNKEWNHLSMEEILTEVEKARQEVIEFVTKLDLHDWTLEVADGMDVYQFLLTVSHHDADTLRSVAQQLYRDYS